MCAAVEVLHGPEFEDTLDAHHAAILGMVLALPQLLGLVIEARLLLALRTWNRSTAIAAGLAGTASALILAVVFPAALPLAILLAGTGQGVTLGLAEATLIRAVANVEVATARWATAAAVGDLLGPLLCGLVGALGGGWRSAFLAAAGMLFVHAALVRRAPMPAAELEEDDIPDGIFALLRANPPLVRALLATTLCSLMDEALVVLGALWLAEQGVATAARDLAFTALAVGLVVGSALVERLQDRLSAAKLLVASGASCAVAYAAWLVSPSAPVLALVGFLGAPLYPLVQARAYSLAPPDTVAAASRVVGVTEALLPLALGLVADEFGLRAALALLLAEPVLLVIVGIQELRVTGRERR